MSDVSEILLPRGFQFGATKAGLKKSGRTDFALIVADEPASAAAAFTANRVTAAPLIIDKENLRASGSRVRVVAINAGNANCAAGEPGLRAARATCEAAAEVFGCDPTEVFPSSTGIIGVPLPAEKLIAVLPALSTSLGAEFDYFQQVAQAILTTDLVEKTAFARFEVADPEGVVSEVRIAALGKGSGMIHPQLVPHATMLVQKILGFPRHLSQHVGGFVLTRGRLDEFVPIGNAAMANRTFLEWDKDDIATLGLMKVDVLAWACSPASGRRLICSGA